MNNIYNLILFYSYLFNINPTISLSIAKVESNYNPNAISHKDAIGIMQLLPNSYPEFTKEELHDPTTNIVLGILHLKEMKKQCHFKGEYEYVICYNRGVNGAKKVKDPQKDKYYLKVKKEMENI